MSGSLLNGTTILFDSIMIVLNIPFCAHRDQSLLQVLNSFSAVRFSWVDYIHDSNCAPLDMQQRNVPWLCLKIVKTKTSIEDAIAVCCAAYLCDINIAHA